MKLPAKTLLLLIWACVVLGPRPGFAQGTPAQAQPVAIEPEAASQDQEDAALPRGKAREAESGEQSPQGVEPPSQPEEAGEKSPSDKAAPEDEFAGFEDTAAEPEGGRAEKKAFDPLRGYNRFMFAFNDKFYLWAWKPAAKGYSRVLPESARVAVDRAFHNFRFPQRFINSLLQLKFKRTGIETGRFLVNSTVGLAGLFDPARKGLGWRRPPEEDFGQTLGSYGVGQGFPLVLPLLGASNLRDGLGMIPDIFSHPVVYIVSSVESVGITAGEYFNRSSLRLEEYERLKKDALDPYIFFRDAYQQNREKKIKE